MNYLQVCDIGVAFHLGGVSSSSGDVPGREDGGLGAEQRSVR